jgi:hypothetical protein
MARHMGTPIKSKFREEQDQMLNFTELVHSKSTGIPHP